MAGLAAVWSDRRMRRSRAHGTLPLLALVLSLALTGCGDDGAKKASGSPSSRSATPRESATELPSGLPTELPTELASCLPTELPTDLSSGVPTDLPTDLAGCLPTDLPTELPTTAATGDATGALDACTVVTAPLLSADLG